MMDTSRALLLNCETNTINLIVDLHLQPYFSYLTCQGTAPRTEGDVGRSIMLEGCVGEGIVIRGELIFPGVGDTF